MRYLAIDFETANSERSSICAFGYALFEDGRVVMAGAELCKPEPNYYDFWNIEVHGITPAMTAHLSGFETLFPRIDQLKPDFLVAHNAAFDISCIRKWCDLTGRNYPQYPYICTCQISRRLYPTMSHSLDQICRMHQIQLNHHEAGSDALACGLILQRAFAETGTRTIDELCAFLRIRMGRLFADSYDSCSGPGHRGNYPNVKKISEITAELDPDVTEESPLYGSCICFTGELVLGKRVYIARRAAARGAIPQDTVTARTDYLVVGTSEYLDFERGRKTAKLQKAEALQAKGKPIEIIGEDEFLDLLRR